MAQNLKINILAQDKTKQALNSVKGGLARVKSAVFSLQTAFVGLGAGLVIKNLVGTGRELENLRVRLKFLLKDTNEGAKAFDNMVKFASKVPFSLEEIQSGSGILATVTDNATDLQKMLEITGNVAATTGLDFRTAAEQIQRSFSAGIGAADLFREKGVRNMLGFKAGATVSIEETVAAFEKVFGRGGRFGNSTDELAKTFEGTLSMIGDKIFNFKKVLLEAGFFEELKRQFGDLDKFLADNAEKLDEIATSVGKNLANAILGAVKIGKDLVPVIREIGAVLGSIIKGFNELPAFVKSIGLVGAMLFGKKGAAALAGISFIIGKIKELSELPRIIPISNMDLKTVKDIDDAISSLKSKIIEPSSFINDVGLEEFEELTDAQIAHNNVVRNQLKILKEIRVLEKQRLPHQLELHKGLKSIAVAEEEIKEKVKKTLDLRKHTQEIIRDAENKEMEKQLFIQTEINKKKMEFNRLVSEAEKEFAKQKNTSQNVLDIIKEQNKQFSLSNEIGERLNQGVKGVSRGFAEALVLGKSLNKSMKELAQNLLVEIIAKTIERIALMGIEKLITKFLFDKDDDRVQAIKNQNKELQKQIALQAILFSLGGGGGGGLPFFNKGGSVSKNQPVIVGDSASGRGGELFVPNSSGQIIPNSRLGSGGGVNVNFTINTVDARGFDQLLVSRRGTITRIINESVNEKGRTALI
jgi:hypothetical protein